MIGIILLNLLIAKMGDTYAKVAATESWLMEKARIIESMEREMEHKARKAMNDQEGFLTESTQKNGTCNSKSRIRILDHRQQTTQETVAQQRQQRAGAHQGVVLRSLL